jgi:hypothetical protein
MVFGFIPECLSASFRKQRSPSPESPFGEAQFSGIDGEYFQSFAPGSVSLFPAIGKPGVDAAYRPRGKIHQQLHEVELRIHLVPAAAAGQAGQDRCAPSTARVSDELRVL